MRNYNHVSLGTTSCLRCSACKLNSGYDGKGYTLPCENCGYKAPAGMTILQFKRFIKKRDELFKDFIFTGMPEHQKAENNFFLKSLKKK